MSDITLEKIDIIRERTNVSYAEAKKALEIADGNVVDALIYIEEDQKKEEENSYTTKDEFINWLKDLVKKGNVNRIKIKKDDRVILNIPVNAGIAATLTMLVWPPLIAIGILTAVITKVTVEIIKDDGSVEVVNKIIKNGVKSTVKDVKDKVHDATSSVKDKFNSKENKYDDKNTYQYTVKFDDINEDDEDKSK
ncbi:DUF4342 domain-containing protein [Clostridium tyrobutyricum]|jgi:hypothetical protein|uniref:N-terminal of elongation factor Ts n=1 Tax=Clostridium tyrobutyricum DIVETGP TaxID=1408889 RepID=W6N751_CLOTY|nr:DUF4342 domain-containing protein [Clostridium tyrobutyricum]AND85656.1 hypothetical protein CTK_C24080 [Clostridium tyrobutyricum]ANP70179.1 ubiquitin [Clostridium tyrobutyricum]MBR9647895.1 DUF4342 domain-containing protein [Clostridium tyrobutyricum]MBV4415053.1 DUF4342 domain-containing protein [Clostridium tyrobutyricum]MBV4421121.1 DUF4342 domain-containing protein [Clostridium tyrobutyricum]